MSDQRSLFEVSPTPTSDTGHKARHGRPRVKGRKTTSVNLSSEERKLLERHAAEQRSRRG